ncbi:hypothetical protein E4U21_003310 [Claviceps maximensis]|nr:hypothetical protein E4U21_003310 [Claviceps maximensis]
MYHARDPFPKPSAGFATKKTRILEQLAVPEAEYTDASPKGTIDTGIRDLIDEINVAEGFVTTSSCAGRVSVFLEGRKTVGAGAGAEDEAGAEAGAGAEAVAGHGHGDATSRAQSQVAGVGGKGAGGTWLFVSHDVVDGEAWAAMLGFDELGNGGEGGGELEYTDALDGRRLIHFKFEPMILHVLTASPLHAQALLQAALQAGFRESGAVNITPQADSSTTPMVAIRSMGLSFESLIGFEANGSRYPLVTGPYLQSLMVIARERFVENAKRIARFRGGFSAMVLAAFRERLNPDGSKWEDGPTRRERMREEGLRRKQALLEAEMRQYWGKEEEPRVEVEEEETVFNLDL